MKSSTPSILLIEDNPDHVFLTRQAVHTAWRTASLFVTCNLDEVRTMRSSPSAPAGFDLILVTLDARDPHRLARLREMQASGEINDAPIMALVSSTREQELARVGHQPKEWIVLKPLRAESLREAIQRRPLRTEKHVTGT